MLDICVLQFYNTIFQVWIDKNSSSVFDKLDKRQHRTFATHLQTLQKVVIIATIPFFGDFIFLFVQGSLFSYM